MSREAYVSSEYRGMLPRLEGFFARASIGSESVQIAFEPHPVYLERLRRRLALNFDFVIRNLSEESLELWFVKASLYDADGHLVSYRYVNRNAVGPSGIASTGITSIPAGAAVDLYNPFHEFPDDLPLASMRYTFTFGKPDGMEIYCGDVVVRPEEYRQDVTLRVPMQGLVTILDAHDYLSHHRRFAMTLVREATAGAFASNFARYGLDFARVGEDGNLARMEPGEEELHRDYHRTDIRDAYTDGEPVFAPGAGTIVQVQDDLDDLYDRPFDMDSAIKEQRVDDIAGNRVIIKHNDREYSHLFHFMRGTIAVAEGDTVKTGDSLGRVGFSGAATVYSHLHYQLMDGENFLHAQSLPCQFTDVELVRGSQRIAFDRTALETGDFLIGHPCTS